METVIPHNLRRARQAAGLTQERVARALDVAEKSYRRWESGETIPSVATLRRLSELFGVSLAWLVSDQPQNEE